MGGLFVATFVENKTPIYNLHGLVELWIVRLIVDEGLGPYIVDDWYWFPGLMWCFLIVKFFMIPTVDIP